MNHITPFNPATLTMTSREISELVESRHDSVKRTIERCAEKGVFTLPPLVETSFAGADGRGQTVSVYSLDKRASLIVVAQLSPEFTARVVDRWQQLEAQAANPLNPADLTRLDILKLAIDSEQARLKAESQLAIAAPKADALDRITLSDGAMCLTNAAKVLNMQPKRFFAWLQENQWIYRRSGGAGYTGYQARIQVGYLDHKVTVVSRSDGSEKTCEQVLVTPKGLAKLAQALAPDAANSASPVQGGGL